MTDEKVSTTFRDNLNLGPPTEMERLASEQEAEERRQAKREYVEAMREGWRRKHGWRNR